MVSPQQGHCTFLAASSFINKIPFFNRGNGVT